MKNQKRKKEVKIKATLKTQRKSFCEKRERKIVKEKKRQKREN